MQKHYPKAILTLKKDQALDSVAGVGGMTDQGRLPGGGECCQELSKRQGLSLNEAGKIDGEL